MAMRVLVYAGLLPQRLIREGKVESGGPYPPVLYNGDRRWTAKTSLAEQRGALPAELERLQLNAAYVLLDESRVPESELPPKDNVAGLVVRLEQAMSGGTPLPRST